MADAETDKSKPTTLLEQALAGEPIMLDGVSKPLLVHALDNQDLRLFSVALKAGASVDFLYNPTAIDADEKKVTFDEYLKRRVNESYSLKPFYTKLEWHLFWKYCREDFTKYLYRGLLFVGVVGAAALNIFFMLQSFLYSQETLQLLNMVIDNAATLGLIGLSVNGYILIHKIHHNFGNPAKSLTNNLVTLIYDVGTFLIKTCAYASYLVLGVTPVAGVFFVTAFAFDSTRGLFKFGRAAYNHWHFSNMYDTDQFNNDRVHAAEVIRSYNRTNRKMLSVVSTTAISVAMTCVIAAYCFMPLTPLGFGVAVISMASLMGARIAVSAGFDSVFESRTQTQIDAHMQKLDKMLAKKNPAPKPTPEHKKENVQSKAEASKTKAEAADADAKSTKNIFEELGKEAKKKAKAEQSYIPNPFAQDDTEDELRSVLKAWLKNNRPGVAQPNHQGCGKPFHHDFSHQPTTPVY